MLTVKNFVFNPLNENTYLLFDESREAVVIDPGNLLQTENQELEEFVVNEHLAIRYILATHPHVDHVFGADFCRKTFKAPFMLHEAGLPIYKHAVHYCVAFGIDFDRFPTPDAYVRENETIAFGHSRLQVLYTPGHTDGSVSYYEADQQLLFTGDLLFKGTVGRTDLPTGNMNFTMQSIREKIFVLPDDTRIYPGHGEFTTIQNEKLTNPYLSTYHDKQ